MKSLIIDNRDVIEKDWCVEKPIYKLGRKIFNAKTNRIILSGGAGVGKSITLYKLQDIGIPSKHPVLYTNVIRQIQVPKGYNETKYLEYYFDTLYSQYLKKYLRSYYFSEIQGSSLLKDGGIIDQRTRELHQFLTAYKPTPIELKPTLLPKAIREAKRLTGIKTISVAVDDFDKHLSSIKLQGILIDALDCFDTTIIGVDSKSITGSIHRLKLRMNGYKIISAKYSRRPSVVEEVVKRRINPNDTHNMSIADGVNYHKLVRVYRGDIFAILDAMEGINSRENIPALFDATSSTMIKGQVDTINKSKSKLFLPIKKKERGTNI